MEPLDERVRRALAPDYEVERRLGEGGMGVVYLAWEVTLRRHVAVKVLRPELDTPNAVARFLREAQALARVKHPNVVTVHVVLPEREGLHFFVMEYIEDPLLYGRLKEGPLPWQEVLALAQHLLAGLAAVHRADVIHLDIKPANIFLTERGAVLGDFGIARILGDSETTQTGAGWMAGTLPYMALEQRTGLADKRTDLYQVGAVLYEAGTGRLWCEAQAGKRAWVGIPRGAASAIRRAVNDNYEERWPDAASFRRALLPRRIHPAWMAGLTAVFALAVLLLLPRVLSWFTAPPPLPPVDLTVLPLSGADSVTTRRLTNYLGEPLERFARIQVRPIAISSAFPEPHSEKQMLDLKTRYWVTGEVLGDRLELQVRNAAGKRLRSISVPKPSPGVAAPAALLAWGRAAADSLVARQFHEHLTAWRDVGGLGGSDDPVAVDAFLKAEEDFNRGEGRHAEAGYREALKNDPEFAVALWHLSLVHRWLRIPIHEELETLNREYRDRLPPQYQALLAAQLTPELGPRFAAYQNAIARFPENGYALLLYADDLYHLGPLEGIPLDSALVVWAAAAERLPYLEQAPVYDHTIWAAIRRGQKADAKRELDRRDQIVTRSHGSRTSEGARRARFFRLAFYERFQPRLAQLLRTWTFMHPDSTLLRRTAEYARLGLSFDIPEAQRALGEILIRDPLDGAMLAEGHETVGLALVMLGRVSEAWPQFDSAARAFRSPASQLERWEWRIVPAVVGLPVDTAELPAARAALEQLERDSLIGARAAWALALDALDRGDPAAAQPSLARLSARAPRDSAAARLSLLLKGFATGRAGRFEEALAQTQPLLRYNQAVRVGDPFARTVLYLLRAEWFERLGRWQEAERTLLWYQNSDIDGWAEGVAQAGDADAALGGIARFRRGLLLLEHADAAQGCRELKRLNQLWQRADSGYAGLKRELATRLVACRR